MPTTTMNISLPEEMKAFVEAQAASGRYSNASDYVRDLIRRDRDRQGGVRSLQAAIEAGLASGVGSRTLDEIMAEARARGSRPTMC